MIISSAPFLLRRLVCKIVAEQVEKITNHAETQSTISLSQYPGNILGLKNQEHAGLFRKLKQAF